MIEFKEALEAKLATKLPLWVGIAVDPTNGAKTFDDHVHDLEKNQFPFIVYSARQATNANSGEIGNDFDLYEWTVHFYVLDHADQWTTGKLRRDWITGKLWKELEKDRRLGNLEARDLDGAREYVFDLKVDDVIFDTSGQQGYYTFVTELYATVFTARSN